MFDPCLVSRTSLNVELVCCIGRVYIYIYIYIYAYMDLKTYVVMLVHACTAVLYIGRTFELYISMCV